MESKIILLSSFFLFNLWSNCGHEWKIIGEMLESSLKNKSGSHLLEEIFWPAGSKS